MEGVTAIWAADFAEAQEILEDGKIPVLIDPNCKILEEIQPQVLIDAILAKKNLGTTMDMAETVIITPPTGQDLSYVITITVGIIALIVIAGGIVLIKKKALGKDDK